jgi:RNA recognition motif-containing protein
MNFNLDLSINTNSNLSSQQSTQINTSSSLIQTSCYTPPPLSLNIAANPHVTSPPPPPSTSATGQQIYSILISNLPSGCTEMDLLVLARKYGNVKSCEMKRDFRNHQVSASGIVSYYTVEDAQNAIRELQYAYFNGVTIQ